MIPVSDFSEADQSIPVISMFVILSRIEWAEVNVSFVIRYGKNEVSQFGLFCLE